MPEVTGNGLPVSTKRDLILPSGLFELVDAKFKRGLTDDVYTLREILSNDNCEILLPTKDKFYKYIKSQVWSENPSINLIQYCFFILSGLLYLPSIIISFYNSSFLAANTNITGETHHSILMHNFAVAWGDYVVPFIITTGIAGIFPLIVFISKIKSNNNKITDILDSVDVERKKTIQDHNLIASFFTLCEILHQIKLAKENTTDTNHQDIINDVISTCKKYDIHDSEIIHSPHLSIEQLNLNQLDTNIRNYLLSKKYSEITKNIICKINSRIDKLEEKALLNASSKKVNPDFKSNLSESKVIQNKMLSILADICAKKIDVRESPIPIPVLLTRDLDLIGVREALFEYWGDLNPKDLVIHYTVDFEFLSRIVLIMYCKRFPEDFYEPTIGVTQRPLIRQGPCLTYPPPPIKHSSSLYQDYFQP